MSVQSCAKIKKGSLWASFIMVNYDGSFEKVFDLGKIFRFI